MHISSRHLRDDESTQYPRRTSPKLGENLVPVGNWTLAKEEEKRVELVGQDDKRMITATFTSTLSGEFLPFQILYTW